MSGLGEVDRWAGALCVEGDPEGIRLARAVTEEVRRAGKHFLPRPLLLRLAEIRARHTPGRRRPFLRAFLDCLLDKHEGRYGNRTYLSLPLLELLLDGPQGVLAPDRLATLLISDVVRFETQAQDVPQDAADRDRDRPGPATARKRLRHALRFIAHDHGVPDAEDLLSRAGGAAGAGGMPGPGRADVAGLLPRLTAAGGGHWFDVTVQPVYVLHDEYFFIRVLQAHEMLFTAIAGQMREVIAELRRGRPQAAARGVDGAAARLERAAALFRLAATMRPEHFSAFRQFTQGASAIQSEQYKRFEILCGDPAAARLESAAFTSVPAVRAEAQEPGHDSVVRAYLDLRRSSPAFPVSRAGRISRALRVSRVSRVFRAGRVEWGVLDASLGRLEECHQRWKSTHRSLAVRMLGTAHGSGYTDGVPYLSGALDNRLFGQLGQGLGRLPGRGGGRV
ncbi:tryptophan 2,3-dioxygenase family protein [Streptomyces sp. NPDC059979]|uniref:tryptophan 2,3-dioxygenase family protein n=1 Tax=Streptomyces sp. NPDC059979 TaxID=3347021 RepID=UPI0036AF58DD